VSNSFFFFATTTTEDSLSAINSNLEWNTGHGFLKASLWELQVSLSICHPVTHPFFSFQMIAVTLAATDR
jgi:hypothetical protein